FAALSAALSQVSIRVGLVPVVLTQVSVFLAAGLLGWNWGALSQALFAAAGVAGLPVFAGFRGGLGALLGPTGGFVWGYILSALAAGLLLDRLGRSWRGLLPALLLGIAAVYLPGVPWLMHTAHLGLRFTLVTYVLPYLPGDIAKAALCAAVIPRLHRALRKIQLQ
ncbi:MAG: biotin transporter BioY, partial [Oscillospiraceae bacterium]|nr:biotin transporter BioY [Oscillospiraceae bacterium]